MRNEPAPTTAWRADSPELTSTALTPPPLTPKEKRRLTLTRILGAGLPLLILVLAIGGFIAMGALKPKPDEKTEDIKALPVLTAIATQEDVTLKVRVQGEVQPRTEINLVPQVSGRITYMSPSFIEGGKFKRGDVLVRIEPEEFELRVVQARANVAQAETAIVRETSEGAIARSDWKELGRAGDPTPLTLREPQLAEARAQLASANARLSEAQLQLNRTTLRAPFTGRVTIRHVDGGEYVTAGTKLGMIYSADVMDVRLPLTNEDLKRAGLTLGYEAGRNSAGIPVALSADVAGRFSQWQGHIVRTDSRFDSKTRVLYAYAQVMDPFGEGADEGVPMAPGIFVDADIDGQILDGIITIPRAGLRGTDTVYIANTDGTLSFRTVQVASSDRNKVIITSGLESGAAVITSPIRGVADGMKVAVVDKVADVEVTP